MKRVFRTLRHAITRHETAGLSPAARDKPGKPGWQEKASRTFLIAVASAGKGVRNLFDRAILTPWPIGQPRRWVEIVNAAQTPSEVEAIRAAMQRGRPFGSDRWVKSAANRLNLAGTLRPRGRPPIPPDDAKKGS